MSRRRIALLLALGVLGGCASVRSGVLSPVQGPLSTQTPKPVYAVTAQGISSGYSGQMSVALPSGENCTGTWASVPQGDASFKDMAEVWDAVYGKGFFGSDVWGSDLLARGVLKGGSGTVINVEMFRPAGRRQSDFRGVAKDNKGNIYKLTF
ncbi:MAG TPA: hypothetical protein VEH54_05040 [Steroidobacteraceae bacterium]|nr:hypothetical protein [Steroidobacteraceae bacterium]